MGSEACRDAIEIGVVVARVADEFEGASGWENAEDLRQCCSVQVSSSRDAYGATGRPDAAAGDLRMTLEVLVEAVEETDLKTALEACVRELLREDGFEGISDRLDGGAFEGAKERSRNAGEEVRVFVGIDVGDAYASLLEFVNLCENLTLDFFFANLAAQERLNKIDE
jgi:hypothetical protein